MRARPGSAHGRGLPSGPLTSRRRTSLRHRRHDGGPLAGPFAVLVLGALLAPAPKAPVVVSAGGTTTPSATATGLTAPVAVYYADCAAARAAGAAPLHLGQPGYRLALDRDRDGIACE